MLQGIPRGVTAKYGRKKIFFKGLFFLEKVVIMLVYLFSKFTTFPNFQGEESQ
jgi:hypothetical protein